MATPKVQEQERSTTNDRAVNGTTDRPFNGAAAVARPPWISAPASGSPAWWAAIRALEQYDPTYPYDPAYEYDDEYTTDPDYGVDGVTYLTTEPHKFALASFKVAADVRRGRCARREFTVYLSDAVRQVLGPDHEFKGKGHLIPDVAVLPGECPPGTPFPADCRLETDPPPLLVLEVLSESTWQSDLGPKRDAYAAMGIAEYWLYDPEGHAPPGYVDGAAFWGWRLDATGTYVRIPRLPREGTWPVYHSEVLGADIRMLPDAALNMEGDLPDDLDDRHRLQWWDADQDLWRDPEVEAKMRRWAETERQVQEGEVRGEAKGKLEERIASMHTFLEAQLSDTRRAQIEANWRRAGQGRTAAEIAAVLSGQADWVSLRFPDQPDKHGNG